ncbi:MAG TPA: hypothetical protein VI056_07770 [Candidatus Limnocylindria bacterium]
MFTLRADPWMPEYGMGFDVRFDEPPAVVEPFIESDDWSAPRSVPKYAVEPVHFIDGVRRIDLRLLADVDGRRVPGLFGTYAAGSALCDGKASFEAEQVGRAVVLGGGQDIGSIEVRIGATPCTFRSSPTPGAEPDDPLLKLQDLMRDAETNMAARLAETDGDLVVVDGPLAFYRETKGPIVGVIKRFGRVYLEPEQGRLIPKLAPGERTPLFAIAGKSDRRRRYAWYSRLTPARAPWHDHAGVVRCEVRGSMALEDAVELADRVAALLPHFSGRAQDPRTPQNLVPIAGLETWLRHRAGDTRLIRRALLDWIATEAAA